jgi:adenylate kinase
LSVEAGKLVREAAKTDPEVDRLANEEGKLIPPKMMFSILTKYIEENDPDINNFILDGYPRSELQNKLLRDWLEKRNRKIDFVIYLTLDEEESIKRLSSRRIDKSTGEIYNLITKPIPEGVSVYQREDDKPLAIKERLKEYHQKTKPVIETYKKENILIEIDGHQPIDVVFFRIKEEIEKRKNG